MEKKTTERTQRRTRERTTVERDAKTNVATAAAFSPASNGTKRGKVVVTCGVLISSKVVDRIEGWSTAGLFRTGWKEMMEAALPPRSSKEKKERDQSRRTNPG